MRRKGMAAGAFGMDDEALWRGADVVEWVARDQGDAVAPTRLKYRQIGRPNDFEFVDSVLEISAGRLQANQIASLNALERPEQAVTVGGNGAVAGFPRPRRVSQMAGGC
jgi:hypothetical protein